MITISNLRKEEEKGWTKLIVDVDWGLDKLNKIGKSIWFSVKKENENMLTTEVYDAFLLVPLYIGMYYKQDLEIKGKVSKKLYKNIQYYVQKIFCDFSKKLSKVEIKVEGYAKVKKENNLIGTGISCGIDSFTTIYDRYVSEDDLEYKINSLFLFNCGTHGDFNDPIAINLYKERFNKNKEAADALGLPIYQVQSNIHQYSHLIGEQQLGYISIYSCIFSIQKCLSRYYTSSCSSYEEIKQYYGHWNEKDMAEFGETYLVPLLQTDNMVLVNDGGQYTRVEKTKRIMDWDIAKNFLNVCITHTDDGHNCSICSKCMRTLLTLDAYDKLSEFENKFDMRAYKKNKLFNLCDFKIKQKKDHYCNEVILLYKEKHRFIPPFIFAFIYANTIKVIKRIKKK